MAAPEDPKSEKQSLLETNFGQICCKLFEHRSSRGILLMVSHGYEPPRWANDQRVTGLSMRVTGLSMLNAGNSTCVIMICHDVMSRCDAAMPCHEMMP